MKKPWLACARLRMMTAMDQRLEKIEKMLSVTLEAICALAKEVTDKTMVVGHFDNEGNCFGATPESEHIKWVKTVE
jgi:hypothetical protein